MEKQGKRDFDAAAAGWDEEPRRVMLARDVVSAICRELPLAKEMEALDYGCGTGLVTLGLQPFVGRITGADSSQGMLDVLRRKVREGGIGNVVPKLIDLEQQQLGGSFDLVVCSMTLHHVHDVAGLIGSFVQMLNPGGWLALADLESEDGSFHDDSTGVFHRGFDREFFSSVCLSKFPDRYPHRRGCDNRQIKRFRCPSPLPGAALSGEEACVITVDLVAFSVLRPQVSAEIQVRCSA